MASLTDIRLFSDILKARYGRYADTAENRRLHRVGQEYGKKKQEEPETNQVSSKKPDDAASSKLAKLEEKKEQIIKQFGEERYNKAKKTLEEKAGKTAKPEEQSQRESQATEQPEQTQTPKEEEPVKKPAKEKPDSKPSKTKEAPAESSTKTDSEEEIGTRVYFEDMPNSKKVKFKKYLSNKIKSRIDESFKNLAGLDDDTIAALHDGIVNSFNEKFDEMKKSERAEALYKVMKVKNELSKRALDNEKAEADEAARIAEEKRAKRREKRAARKARKAAEAAAQQEAQQQSEEEKPENPNIKKEVAEQIQDAIYESQDNPEEGQVDNTSETDPGKYDGNSWFKGDTSKMSKDELADRAVKHIQNFLKVNNLPVPEFIMKEYPNAKNKFQKTGHYSRAEGKVYLNAANTRNPVLKPGGMQWSFPGYKVDKTPLGVLAHEVGHHIDHVMNLEGMPLKGNKITGYEPTYHESIAESLRLFILNPDLLNKINPERYKFFIGKGLKPTVTAKWNEVLGQNAPKEYSEQINKNYG